MVDSTFVHDLPAEGAVAIPLTQMARTEAGSDKVANIAALAALAVLTKVVSLKSLTAAVLARIPKGTEELNKKALKAGEAAAREYLATGKPESPASGEPEHGDENG